MFGEKVQENKCGDRPKTALVAVGANLPWQDRPPETAVSEAMHRLAERCADARFSRLWRTPAFPPGAGPAFVNAAMALGWSGTPEALLETLHDIETSFGRIRTARWEARIMDLDLLAIDDLVLPDLPGYRRWAGLDPVQAASRTPGELVLPHPRMTERAFVLAPLADVAPGWRHPVTGRTVAEMLDDLPEHALDGVEPLDGR